MAVPVVVKIAAKLAADKKGRKIIGGIITGVLILLFLCISCTVSLFGSSAMGSGQVIDQESKRIVAQIADNLSDKSPMFNYRLYNAVCLFLLPEHETLDKEVDREVVYQYIQHPMIAKDFAAYLALYNKYKTDYAVEDLLQGKWTPIILGKIRNASLDEHLSIVGLLNGKLSQLFADCYFMDAYVTKLYGYMTEYRDNLPEMTLESIYKKAENDFQTTKKSELLTKNEEKVFIRTVDFLEKLWIELRGETGSEDKTENNKAVEISEKDTYERAKTAFATEADSLETQTEYISQTLQNVFDFMEAAFGDSQEMVAFITELNANFYSIWFIRENGSDQYYRHNKGLLFDDRQKLILGQMEELENTMKRGLKN